MALTLAGRKIEFQAQADGRVRLMIEGEDQGLHADRSAAMRIAMERTGNPRRIRSASRPGASE
jgi:hypothetical protein